MLLKLTFPLFNEYLSGAAMDQALFKTIANTLESQQQKQQQKQNKEKVSKFMAFTRIIYSCDTNRYFFCLSMIMSYVRVRVWWNLFGHSDTDGHLGYFQCFTMTNSTAVRGGAHLRLSMVDAKSGAAEPSVLQVSSTFNRKLCVQELLLLHTVAI